MHEPRLFDPQRSAKARFDQEGRRSWLPVGRNYSRRLFAAGVAALSLRPLFAHDDDDHPILNRVAMIHGGTGPFAVAGYRMGEAALKQLKLNRGSFHVEVIHYAPHEVQWSCIIDGLQAATGASAGKLNLNLMESTQDKVYSVIRNRKTGQEVKLELTPEFIKKNLNLPEKDLSAAGVRVIALQENKVFRAVR